MTRLFPYIYINSLLYSPVSIRIYTLLLYRTLPLVSPPPFYTFNSLLNGATNLAFRSLEFKRVSFITSVPSLSSHLLTSSHFSPP